MTEPVWLKHLDPVFCETNKEMKLTSSTMETSLLKEHDGEYEEEQNGKEDIFSGADDMDENNKLESEIEASNELNVGNTTSGNKRKVIVAHHRKAKQVRSNKQVLSEIANGLKALAQTSQKNSKMMIEEERKREERYLSFRKRKRKRIDNTSSLSLKYLLMHRSHNSHIVLNLERVTPPQLLTRINPYKML